MAVKSVIKLGDPRLRHAGTHTTEVDVIANILEHLRDTLSHVRGLYIFYRGAGISANQIGYARRISVTNFQGREYVLIDPVLIAHSDEQFWATEGCLSFFAYRAQVRRWCWVELRAYDEDGIPYILRTENPDFSSLLQHELDHLDGLLYVDRRPRRRWGWIGPRLRRKHGAPLIP